MQRDFHFPAGDGVAFDAIAAGRRRMFRVAAQIDAGFEHLRLAQCIASEAGVILVAVRGIDVEQTIAQNAVASADDEDPAELHALQPVVFHQDVARLHIDVGVVEHDAEVAEGIVFGLAAIDAGVGAHRAVVEAVQVDALAVDLFELVRFVARAVQRCPRCRSRPACRRPRRRWRRPGTRCAGRDCRKPRRRRRGRSGWRRGRSR